MTAVIAVHCGAGSYSSRNHLKYKNLSKRACRKGMEILRKGGSSLDAVTAVITILENDPVTNAGFGSNLTLNGCVEMDASIMDGKTLNFGACGAVKNIKNPIKLAREICVKQQETLPLGLVPPCLLVGKGASDYGKCLGLEIVNGKRLKSQKSVANLIKYKYLLEKESEEDKEEIGSRLDTVGAVCVDSKGQVAAGCSSGGILLKKPGRIGQAAVFGSGVWADSFDSDDSAVAVCTTGCGEHLIRTQLAKEIAEDVKASKCPTQGLSQSISDKFLNSRYLQNISSKLCGALVLHINSTTKDITILWGHSTESMGVGYMGSTQGRPTAMISELPRDATVGSTVNVGGTYICNVEMKT